MPQRHESGMKKVADCEKSYIVMGRTLTTEPAARPKTVYRICSRVFLLLQSAGKSIHWIEVNGLPGAAGGLLLPA
jgi:hypothetical protein